MSIAVLTQVYEESRRLAVAGSVVSRGDFRLKKLLPALDQAGARAPVFAKVAENARAVIDGAEETSAESLLELTSLVTAILYTQGETGLPGTLAPIETVDLGGTASQTSARLLKPLLEALASTGSGRLDLVKDAHQRGAFRDLRLVKPALDGLDDPYADIADYLAEHVLPLYGQAVLPELRAKYDPKGTKGHARRLKLMHGLDPAGTRDLVKAALESGSKEVKVAAIECLGAAKEDLEYLIEQSSSKVQDVRAAAYLALARIDDPAAVAVLAKAIAGKDLDLATRAISESNIDKLSTVLIAEIGKERDTLTRSKDKKQVSTSAQRLIRLIAALPDREHEAADALTLELFNRRAELAKAKGETLSGSDVTEKVLQRMMNVSPRLRTPLARAHAELDADQIGYALDAAWRTFPAAEVYDLFSPYFLSDAEGKKKGKDAGHAKRQALLTTIGGDLVYLRHHHNPDFPPLDPRWMDLAVRIEHIGLLNAVGQPGHPAAEAFLDAKCQATFKTAKTQDQLYDIVIAMVQLSHPKAAEALIASYEKTIGKANVSTHWYHRLIPSLPKSALPKLEAVTPKLKDREADRWVEAIEALRGK